MKFDNNNHSEGCDIIENQFLKIYKKYKNNDTQFEFELKNLFNNSNDVIIRNIKVKKINYYIIYIDGMIDKDLLDRDIIKVIANSTTHSKINNILHTGQISIKSIDQDFTNDVLSGNVVVISSNEQDVVISDLKGWSQRSIEIPDSENIIRGPKESFTETLRVNTSLIRRKVKNPNLIFENIILGKQTNTDIVIGYIKGIVNEEVLAEIKTKIDAIDADSILESGYLEQYLENASLIPIATIGYTQKPDVAAAKILEGRVVIICDGTPYVLTIPHLFVENIQTSEDYYQRQPLAIFLRIIRITALIISLLLPGFYVAVTTFHQEMIPSILLKTIAASTVTVPFPKGFEAFLMLFIFEILKESGTRLPKPVGSAVSIMGALVIGEAAVNAGIIGPAIVIVISLTALASFILPTLWEFMTIYRLLFLLMGSIMGLIGITALAMMLVAKLISMESFGIPYMSIRNANNEIKDFVFKSSIKKNRYRPWSLSTNKIRRGQ